MKERSGGRYRRRRPFFDHTRPADTFFGTAWRTHRLRRPVCPDLSACVHGRARSSGASTGGAYLCMEGPPSRRAPNPASTEMGVDASDDEHAEEARTRSEMLRDARARDRLRLLARTQEDVSIDAILDVLRRNVENSKRIVRRSPFGFPAGAVRCGRR